jgi:hypothetical protein
VIDSLYWGLVKCCCLPSPAKRGTQAIIAPRKSLDSPASYRQLSLTSRKRSPAPCSTGVAEAAPGARKAKMSSRLSTFRVRSRRTLRCALADRGRCQPWITRSSTTRLGKPTTEAIPSHCCHNRYEREEPRAPSHRQAPLCSMYRAPRSCREHSPPSLQSSTTRNWVTWSAERLEFVVTPKEAMDDDPRSARDHIQYCRGFLTSRANRVSK